MVQNFDAAPDWAIEPEVPALVALRERIDSAFAFLRRRFLGILACLFLSLGVGLGYLLITPPIFTASAVMMLDTSKPHVFQQSILGDVPIDSAWIDTQIGIIKSENVAVGTVKRLHLTEDPKFARYRTSLAAVLPGRVARLFGLESGQGTVSEADLAGTIASGLEVKRVGDTYMVRITFASYDAEQSAKIVNAVVGAYVAEQTSARDEANRRASDWLQDRFQTLREQAGAAERAVVDFKEKNNIVTTGGKSLTDQNLTALDDQLAKARAHTEDLATRLGRIESVIHDNQQNGTTWDAAVSEEMTNPVIQGLRTQYLQLQNRETLWAAQYGSQHQAVINLRNQLKDIRNNILSELNRIVATYKSEYQIAQTQQAQLEKQWTKVVSQSDDPSRTTLGSLQNTADTYRTLYSTFMQKYMESVQQQSIPFTEARLVTPAAGAFKSKPKPMIVWAIVLLAGGMLGVGFGACREVLDSGFRTGAQVRSALDANCIALVPMLSGDIVQTALNGHSVNGAAALPRTISSDSKLIKTLIDKPLSAYAESFRSIKLALDQVCDGSGGKILGLTSSVPEEGKSTIAAGIAELAASSGKRVILIDCDFRNPSLTRLLAPHAREGFVQVISGKATLEDTVWRDPGTRLDFLPVTNTSRWKNTSEFYSAAITKRFFEELRGKYDYILVDLCPLAPIVDARAAVGLVDFYILVIEWGVTKIEMVQHVLKEAPRIHKNIIGVVLNKVDMATIGRYETQNPLYVRNGKYARYGYHDA